MSFELVCPARGDLLHKTNGGFRSDGGQEYPVVGGVAVLVAGVEVDPRGAPLPPAVIDQLLDALALSPALRPRVEEVFAHKFSFTEEWIQTEADQFLHRVAASHTGLSNALQVDELAAKPSYKVNEKPVPVLSSIFKISAVRAGSRFSVNLRLENAGKSTLSSGGSNPVMLAYHWECSGGATREGDRTPLLDDLLPDRAITIPIFIEAPSASGSYKLRIRALQEGVGWFDQTSLLFAIEVGNGPATVDEPAWNRTGNQFDYMDDHFEAVRLLKDWSKACFDRSVEHVVELGGNANPMIDHLDALQKYNVDVDPFGMIVGNLVREGGNSTVKFIIADGMALPMRPKSIDMLVMFATFHHFPDPIGLLSGLSDFVHGDGLICLMCEPIGHVHGDTLPEEYIREIRKGVNEQSFELWEYQQIFDAAGLHVVTAQIDVGSAKFALRCKAARP